MSFFNITDQTDRLNKVLLGNWVFPEYFDSIRDERIREPLKKMSEEVLEDLENFEKILKQHGVEVHRPQALNGVFDHKNPKIPALAVRNHHHVIGNKLFQLNKNNIHHQILNLFSDYVSDIVDISDIIECEHNRSVLQAKNFFSSTKNLHASKNKYQELAGSDWPSFENFVNGNYNVNKEIADEIKSFSDVLFYQEGLSELEGPNIMLFNNTFIVDHHEYADYASKLKQHVNLKDFRWATINTGAGHTDGCYVYLNRSTVITIADVVSHQNLFPDITEIHVPWENYQKSLENFKKVKPKNKGKWWLPGEEDNDQIIWFINQYLDHWTGYTEETVFDVNVLPLDSRNVFISSDNPKMHSLLENHGINPIHVPWRHRFFTDNGLHCITLCLSRG